MADATSGSPDNRSARQIEADIDARRERLSSTVDELAAKAHPKAILARAQGSAKARLDAELYDEDHNLRTDRVAMALGVVSAFFLVSGLIRRARG